MNLYLLSQEINNGYDSYDSFVVAAESEEEARKIHPSEYVTHSTDEKWYGTRGVAPFEEYDTENGNYGTWVPRTEIDKIKVVLLGKASEGITGIICTSFNAG